MFVKIKSRKLTKAEKAEMTEERLMELTQPGLEKQFKDLIRDHKQPGGNMHYWYMDDRFYCALWHLLDDMEVHKSEIASRVRQPTRITSIEIPDNITNLSHFYKDQVTTQLLLKQGEYVDKFDEELMWKFYSHAQNVDNWIDADFYRTLGGIVNLYRSTREANMELRKMNL